MRGISKGRRTTSSNGDKRYKVRRLSCQEAGVTSNKLRINSKPTKRNWTTVETAKKPLPTIPTETFLKLLNSTSAVLWGYPLTTSTTFRGDLLMRRRKRQSRTKRIGNKKDQKKKKKMKARFRRRKGELRKLQIQGPSTPSQATLFNSFPKSIEENCLRKNAS